jgi:Co/Zn/Cd efflux system component
VQREGRSDTANMGLSKSTRIMILLAIDTAFFFVELIAGYTVHSLALVADSFHMVRISGSTYNAEAHADPSRS